MNAIAAEPAGPAAGGTTHYRAVFVSDVHLGTRGSRAEFLADFLAHTSCDTLYPGRRHHRRLAAAPLLVLGRPTTTACSA